MSIYTLMEVPWVLYSFLAGKPGCAENSFSPHTLSLLWILYHLKGVLGSSSLLDSVAPAIRDLLASRSIHYINNSRLRTVS